MKKVYRCSDSITGIFSAVYDAWINKTLDEDSSIQINKDPEQELFCEYIEVTESEKKVIAVENMVKRYLGYAAYYDLSQAALSFDYKKGDAILGTIKAAREIRDSKKIMDHLSHPSVHKVFALSKNVGGEAHNLTEFIRFRELTNGVLFAQITPKNQVLARLSPHFADRFPEENWMIYDKTHHMFSVHEAKHQWVLVSNVDFNEEFAEDCSEAEKQYSILWKGFTKSISIKERENRRCQMSHLPLRYRGNMTEFTS
ncbi:MAG: TIGR03915 family putative DNA repair protein [Suipraeoptans sp.]